MRNIFITITIAVLISACTSNTPLPTTSPDISLIDYAKELKVRTSAALDKVVTKLHGGEEDYEQFKIYQTHWCPRHIEVNSASAVSHLFDSMCRRKGGVFEKPYCRSQLNKDEILFYANAEKYPSRCSDVATANVTIIEPKRDLFSQSYINKLKTFGYQTQGEIEKIRKEAQKEKEFKQELLRKKVKLKYELLQKKMKFKRELLGEAGTKVCKEQINNYKITTHIGHIEQVAPQKIKISISEKKIQYLGESPSSPKIYGLTPKLSWESPREWYVCEE